MISPAAENEAALAMACRWIDARLDEMWLPRSLLPSLKAAGELGHAADQLLRLQDPRWRRIGAAWLDRAWAWFAGGDVLRRLIAVDARFAPAVITFMPFYLQGRTNDELIADVSSRIELLQLRPYEWTIVVAAFDLLGIDCGNARRQQGRTISVLANQPDPTQIPVDAMYLLAHEYLYGTAWGRHAELSADVDAYLRSSLPVLIERCCELGDADVLAEILLVASMHGIATRDSAWRILLGAQHVDGMVRAPRHSTMMLTRATHPRLGRNYHTTIATIMAWGSRQLSEALI